MKKLYLYLIAILFFVILLSVNCRKGGVAEITFTNVGEFTAVVMVNDTGADIAPANSYTFRIAWPGAGSLRVEVIKYAKSENPDDYTTGSAHKEVVTLKDGDHLYFDIEVFPVED